MKEQWRDIEQQHIDQLIKERSMYEQAARTASVENRRYAASHYRDMAASIARIIDTERGTQECKSS